MKSYHYWTTAALTRLDAGAAEPISSVALVRTSLGRIDALNPALNAFITVTASQALDAAANADRAIAAGRSRGPLHGLPIGIKDFYDTAGIRTTAAFERYKDRVPAKDAAAVATLKRAGAVIVGKTNMHTLGMGTTGLESAFGPVANPWNAAHIPGGSSSGSAAAVASGLCYATLDTDAIGSCRMPAACCGVVGFKGTFGLINPQGILEGEQPPDEMILWLSHAAITTRSAQDTALVLNVLAERRGPAAADFAEALTTKTVLRVGAADNLKPQRVAAEVYRRAVETIRRIGHDLRKAAVPFVDLRKGIKNIKADRKTIAARAFKDIDVFILPTTTASVPLVKDARGNPQALSPEYTMFANYYGLPAISVPCGFDERGLPLGLQIVGKPGEDAAVLRLAHQYEAIAGFGAKHPAP